MSIRSPITKLTTHEVTNQPPPLENFDAYGMDHALVDAIAASDAGKLEIGLRAFGEKVGAAQTQQWARQANRFVPEWRPFDRFGQRIDEVEFHPAWHSLMDMGISNGIASIAWSAQSGGHTAHAAMMYLMGHADSGVCCPFSMTYAAMPVLRRNAELAAQWEPRILAASYDSSCVPAAEKSGVTIGMAMTEKQGGSDVRANSTRATPMGETGEFELVGHKWFCSAPMSDAFLTLAQTDEGLTCFFVPRWRPDGTRNAIQIARLKDKLGDRSNASSEIEYHGAWAQRVGEQGRGVRTIIDMVQGTRLDCLAGSAGIMRAALSQALWHCRYRSAFGKTLINQPLMAQVLADLCLEAEAATALTFRVAASFDRADDNAGEAAFARLATPLAKYWICKRTPGFVYEAMECLGGAGYVEETVLPRLYRQAPLNSIWEGSGNVIALDVLRALQREPLAVDAFVDYLESVRGCDTTLDRRVAELKNLLTPGAIAAAEARHLVERMALVLQASVLVERGPPELAGAFCGARIGAANHQTFGAGSPLGNPEFLLDRAMPQARRQRRS
jgi:putative acyl-CoA dehydrogenase